MKQVNSSAKPHYEFKIEPYQNKVRLIILKDGIELACRKQNRNPIQKFIEGEETSIFKGRLQLEKSKTAIELLFKREKVLSIKPAKLLAMLDAVKIKTNS